MITGRKEKVDLASFLEGREVRLEEKTISCRRLDSVQPEWVRKTSTKTNERKNR